MKILIMQRVKFFLLLSLILNIFGIVPVLAEEILHIPEPRIKASGQTYYIDGYGPLVEDIIHSDAYGTKGTPGKKMGGGQTEIPFSESEEATYAHFQNELWDIVNANFTDDRVLSQKLVALAHKYYQSNAETNNPPANVKNGPQDYLRNLVNRTTACGNVAMATDLMFNLAGFKTRIVRLSSNPDSVPNGNHI